MPETRYELWQRGILVAATEGAEEDARNNIQHYAALYVQDGPIVIKERRNGRMRVVAEARLA